MVDRTKFTPEQAARIELGERTKAFLESYEWRELVKPIIDSMVTGLVDIRNLKSADIASEVKARPEVIGRKLAAEYLSEIVIFLEGYVADAQTIMMVLDRQTQD